MLKLNKRYMSLITSSPILTSSPKLTSSPVPTSPSNSSQFINNDTIDQINKYIDNICSDPKFLCNNRDLCGNNSSLYTSVENVNSICSNLTIANQCENNFKECVVLVKNTFSDSQNFITTSFVNIIIPIPNSLDSYGNHKFLRLPALSGSPKEGSLDVCNLCMCMNRFAQSPGAGNNTATSPGQNQCVYPDSFEYYYYPLDIQYINSKLINAPPVVINGKNIINSNIIYAHSEDDLLNVETLYDLLINNGITQPNTINFILNVLFPNNKIKSDQLNYYINNKVNVGYTNINKHYKNMSFYYLFFVILLVFLFIV